MPSVQANDTMRTWGSRYARLILEKCERNKRQACEVLGISYHTLNAYLNYQPGTGRAKRRWPPGLRVLPPVKGAAIESGAGQC